MSVFESLQHDSRFERLVALARSGKGPYIAAGLWGSAAPILAALLARRLQRPLLLITAHVDEADDCRDDIETAIGQTPDLLPPIDTWPQVPSEMEEVVGERIRLCLALMDTADALNVWDRSDVWDRSPTGLARETHDVSQPRLRSKKPHSQKTGRRPVPQDTGCKPVPQSQDTGCKPVPQSQDTARKPSSQPQIIVASIHALMQPVPAADALLKSSRTLEVAARVDPDELTQWLDTAGFRRCEQVEIPGDFARRGGIVDIFGLAHPNPVRFEFFGDQIESIRLFEAGTQRSAHPLGSVRVPAWRRQDGDVAGGPRTRASLTASFLSYLPAGTIVALHEPLEIQELGRTYWQRLGERAGMFTPEAVLRGAGEFSHLYLQRFGSPSEGALDFEMGSLPQFEPRSADALRALAELAADHETTVLCETIAEQTRFRELLLEESDPEPVGPLSDAMGPVSDRSFASRSQTAATQEQPAPPDLSSLRKVQTAVGVVHRGFRFKTSDSPLAFIPHHELFHRYRQHRTLRRVQPSRPIDTFFDLNAGDHVVHVAHGIGKFFGLKTLERAGRSDEYLAIEFADHAVVHVPTSQVHVVQKYIGSFRGKPTLSKVGGLAWKRTKQRVADAVTDMAGELLAVQARRAVEEGLAYPADTTWQREFEEAFPYAETEDQVRAIAEIKADQTRPRPMDRLLCGDVGYGKTELAMRAAFKVIEFGKQVAVLAPTTVLAEQHFETFRERLADYPFSVEAISRFRTRAEQAGIIERARKGQIDILIGTHRLLSHDVRFADLGLVVIDEEQRFGVEAKERLKRLRATVDLLTLSATPIPRTLHMAMLGMRDISSLATAPVDRRAIVTQVRPWERELIREAIERELSRDGQVYFVHNFVRDLHEIANEIRAIVPDARVVVGHGQMEPAALEDAMLKFLHHEADVLVSTNIVESGLDIPTANTIFINRAERFGLADLHQLRGRVGRSKNRAYCYLLLSPKHPVKDTAARRLKAIEHYSDLGAGFQIAMRDLELRGAGNILGPEQSGHIEAVGYEMYCQLLEQAVRKMRNEPAELWRPVNLELGIAASIPRSYIRGEKQRMEVYKRLASCRTMPEVAELRQDLRDAYGALPDEVEPLMKMAEIRVLAQPWGIRSIVLTPPDLVFAIDDLERVQPLFSAGPGSPRVPDPKTIHWRLPPRLLEPAVLLDVLLKQLASAEPAGPIAPG